jgi:Asp-tRNA(Asn)/Glu-tRNA(Gln) amidotransferase A subunit family amidase
MYLNDVATIPANLAGFPGMSLPSGLADEDAYPPGVQDPRAGGADDRLYRVGGASSPCSSIAGAGRCSTGSTLAPLEALPG